jgi:hypothetical protein
MGRAKEIILKVIPAKIANEFVKKHHYSGKVVQNSKLHFDAFLDGKLHGVMSYGASTDKSKILSLVKNTGWNDFLELNRMAFDDYLPKNSESRCISQSVRMIKKQAPNIKWIVSFADGCSCGDGTIYRASGFLLTGIKKNSAICRLKNGEKIHKLTLNTVPFKKRPELGGKSFYEITKGKYSFKTYVEYAGAEILDGYQLRYIYFIDKSFKENLTVPIIPFSKIEEMGAKMYKGEKITRA